MKKILAIVCFFISLLFVMGCTVFGDNQVNEAPYTVLEKEDNIELRHYERLVLVTTPMSDNSGRENGSFPKLFNYISGENKATQEIPMTAPVFMDQVNSSSESMSFVLPKDFTLETAPLPQDPTVKLEEITNFTVAVITFNGFLKADNINEHKAILEKWITTKGYTKTGQIKTAGYNPPYTIPSLRRNEVLIEIKKP